VDSWALARFASTWAAEAMMFAPKRKRRRAVSASHVISALQNSAEIGGSVAGCGVNSFVFFVCEVKMASAIYPEV
jgi:hypothetical protein